MDTSVFIYHLEAHLRYAALTRTALSQMESGKWRGVTSAITLMEINVRPWQLGREDIARGYEALLVNFPNLTILDIDRDIARTAAQLRARFNVRAPDALQVAASLSFGAKAFLTNDSQLTRLQNLMDVVVLENFIG